MLDLKPDERVLDVGCGIGERVHAHVLLHAPEHWLIMLDCGFCCPREFAVRQPMLLSCQSIVLSSFFVSPYGAP